jgi:glycosyltransferase involved in cell wall biosynthesis
LKLAILGTRGVPNQYGGFEQFAEYLSVGLVKKGHDITVYNSHTHPYKENSFKGVKIKHVFDTEFKIGTAGQFVYDLLCIRDTRKIDYDIILQLGYTSSSVFFDFHSKGTVVVTNMDGLEWKRTKYSRNVQRYLQWAESLAVRKSDFLISDSIGIQVYLAEKYNIESEFIPYGSDVVEVYEENILDEFRVKKYDFDMLIARLEPENSIEIILDGVVNSELNRKFLVIGKPETRYGQYLKDKYNTYSNIQFVGAVYDINKLNSLRYFANLYFHGHTVGGTNPSLLEAMGSGAYICANDNLFNKSILGDDAIYFSTSRDVKDCLMNYYDKNRHKIQEANFDKVKRLYSWEKIIAKYEDLFNEILSS